MHSKELAAKLIAVLEKTCPGIRHDYSLREIEWNFDRTINEICCAGLTEPLEIQNSFDFSN